MGQLSTVVYMKMKICVGYYQVGIHTPSGESPVSFGYTYVSNSESPRKCRKACEACDETLEIRYQ